MKVSFLLGTLTVLALGHISLGQSDGKQFCQSVVQCYEEVVKLADDCQKQNANRKPANTSSTNNAGKCKAAIADKTAQLKDKQRQHRQTALDCVKGRVNEAMSIPAKLSAKCDAGSSSSSSNGNNNGQRSKRQVKAETKSSTNVTTTTNDGGSNNQVDGDATGGGRGNGRGNGKGKGKGRGNGNGQGKGNGCQKQVHQKQQQCQRMAKCCSEVAYCHLKFELSDLHDQIRQIQLDILEQRRQCQKQQPQTQGASSNSSSVKSSSLSNNVLRDSIVEDDDDEDEFHLGPKDED